jgi:hypothetical protein
MTCDRSDQYASWRFGQVIFDLDCKELPTVDVYKKTQHGMILGLT